MQMHSRTPQRMRRVMAWMAGSALVVAMAATAWATLRAPATPARTAAPVPPATDARAPDEASAFIARWGAEAKARYGVAPADWRRSLSDTFAYADARAWANARAATSLDGALAALTRTAAPAPVRVPGAAADLPELQLTVIEPCRIADTRVAVGRLGDGETRLFKTVESSHIPQGGRGDGCELESANPVAMLVTVTAVLPSRAGYATVHSPDEPRPLAAAINYAAGDIVNNTVAVKVDTSVPERPFALYSYAGADYVVDIVGYYTPRVATEVQMDCELTQTRQFAPSGYPFSYVDVPQCTPGYTAVSAHCQSYGSTAPGREGDVTMDWGMHGLMGLQTATERQLWTVCEGLETMPKDLGGGTVVMVFDQCCRVREVPSAP